MTLLNQFVRRAALVTIGFAFCLSDVASTQVKTTVPDVVPGASPATVERITIHGKALEGNLEGDAVDRPAIVFLPPGYARDRDADIRWSTRCTAIRSARSSGRRKSTCRRRSKARSPAARRR